MLPCDRIRREQRIRRSINLHTAHQSSALARRSKVIIEENNRTVEPKSESNWSSIRTDAVMDFRVRHRLRTTGQLHTVYHAETTTTTSTICESPRAAKPCENGCSPRVLPPSNKIN
uniref:Uncharacterized protein n=1 Tax=Anopheles melas TaxID=34690 RepID=A0A182TRC4_9DIPT